MDEQVQKLLAELLQKQREEAHRIQAEGIAAAKERGVKFGRPIKKPPRNFEKVVEKWENGEMTFKQAIRRTKLTEATFYRRLRELRKSKESK